MLVHGQPMQGPAKFHKEERAFSGAGAEHRGAELIVTACVMSAFGVTQEDIDRRSRGPARTALARQVSMYLHHVVLERTLTSVAQTFGRDRTTVAHACRVIEDRRDDPEFEATLSALEEAIASGLRLVRLCPVRAGGQR
ncbi:hypothetical protein H1W37_04500 [Stappia taiwanensis]|uniref:Chromosomal replication initiator DnaA C-terminal domain-containing protein n=1 Tax=Stappia taiwanensis TaxID=992267 RepID=A0A838XHM8_9HYPH|nr:helix-turn-helix domain-containing protein [Stappia taiwanensis]MBA4610899.1 hypothetical protein [Stappia taiwanensis]GGE95013.1 hypothetical protein GCM10007285_23310 [Stappia taiwanensis]